MHLVKLLIPLLFIVFVSGCTTPITGSGAAIVINDFEPQFSDVFSTEDVTFEARIQNAGSLPIQGAMAYIVGIEDWEFIANNYPECTNGFGLIPPGIQGETQGATKLCSWIYKAPFLPKDLSTTYSPTLRVFYDYFSNTVSSVSIVPRDELRRLQNSGLQLPVNTQASTEGPVTITLETEPVLSFEESVIFPLKITVNNVGNGIVCYPQDCKNRDNWNTVRLVFDMGNTIELLDCGDMEISLYKGKSNTIVCRMEAFEIPDATISKRTINVGAEYGYMVEKTTSISVNSKPS